MPRTIPGSGVALAQLQGVQQYSLGTTSRDGILLENLTAAASGLQQMSPRIRFTGRGWETSGGTSQVVDWIEEILPVQGTAASADLIWSSQVNAGNYTARLRLTSAALRPASDDGLTLGISGTAWADLFLASGAVINFNAGNYTLTHSAGLLTTNGALAIAGALSGVTTLATSSTINSQTISSAANFTGSMVIATTLTLTAGPVYINASASYGRLGQKLEVNTSANYGGMAISTWSATASEAPLLDLNRSKSATIGTLTTALASDDILGYIVFRGSDGVSAFIGGATIQVISRGTFTATVAPSRFDLFTFDAVSSKTRIIIGEVTQTSAAGAILQIPAQTMAANNGNVTLAIGAMVSLGVTTFTNATASLTYTNSATLYIAGIPVASTNVILTNPAYAVWVDAGEVRIDGDIGDASNKVANMFLTTLGATGTRLTQAYFTNHTTTNAETVDSWGMAKYDIEPYNKSALDIVRNIQVISFKHLDALDPSGRIKLGVRAESIRDSRVTPYGEYGAGLGFGPRLDTMGLQALNTKSIQELLARIEFLEATLAMN